MQVEIYSDVVCPWCYIGERRFERAMAAYPGSNAVEVVFRPYQLDPGAPVTAVPLRQYLERRFGGPADAMMRQVGAAAAGEGIEIEWERALAVNTFEAHRLLRLAQAENGAALQRALVERLFAAHFTEGRDVSDAAVLTGLAVSVGMEEDRVRDYLASGEGAAELEAELAEARSRGIRAVPTFVFEGQYVIEGAQSPETFARAVEEVEKRLATQPDVGLGG